MKARVFAYRALCAIMLEKTYSNLYLKKHLQEVEERERALASALVYGTLQNHLYVRYQWEYLADKAVKKETAILLDLSVYQLLFMDSLPDYAVINEAVEIARRQFGAKSAPFVNALLRNVLRKGKRPLPQDEMERLAIETSHPLWLLKMWKAQYGMEMCRATAYYDNRPRRTTVRVNTMKTTVEKLLAEGCYEKGRLCPDALVYTGTESLAQTSDYLNGLVSMQDEASMMVAHIVNPKPGERILDACSAPGSKACHMAERMQDQGVIVSCDIHAHRVDLIRAGAKRLGLRCIQPMVNDATKLSHLPKQSFDRVLCDVPCSGYGVLGRKSDIRVHMRSEDMDTLIPLQYDILKECATMVKPGGIVVYSTCTLNKKENEKQIERFLKEHEGFALLGMKTIFPFSCDSDGFFIAKLRAKA